MKIQISIFLFLIGSLAQAQLRDEFYIAEYSFEDFNTGDVEIKDDRETASFGITTGNVKSVEGVKGKGIEITEESFVSFLSLDRNFSNRDFSVSFYFLPTDKFTTKQEILSKRLATCGVDGVFSIIVSPSLGDIEVTLSTNASLTAKLEGKLSSTECWQHVVVARKNRTITLYINGVVQDNFTSTNRVDVSADGETLRLGKGICSGTTTNSYKGLIDELTIFKVGLEADEVARIYTDPDRVSSGVGSSRVVNLYLGDSFTPEVIAPDQSTAIAYEWKPEAFVDQPFAKAPQLTPTETTTFIATFKYESYGCRNSIDSIRVVVIDPDEVECSSVVIPKAFTPNGDNLNDGYGISNSFIIRELIRFEIYDRWGNVMFQSDDIDQKWDGSYKGLPVMPGVYMYKIRYICNDSEQSTFGNFVLIR